jgi:raffinose/stachyose/melibiose transport system permease protein
MFKIENFRAAWIDANLSGYFLNTVIVSAVSVVVIILAAAMAGYILSRVRPNVYLYTFFTLGIMIPVQALIVPIFIIANRIHITNSRLGLTVVYIAVNLSISIFILYGFMKSIPRELEDAAAIDGCTRNRTFFKIILPISMPGLSTTAIFALLTCWNEFLLPLVLITHGANKVLSQGIQDMKGQYITDYGILTAGIVIVTVPVILLYVLFQEQVIKGMTSGAIKG